MRGRWERGGEDEGGGAGGWAGGGGGEGGHTQSRSHDQPRTMWFSAQASYVYCNNHMCTLIITCVL